MKRILRLNIKMEFSKKQLNQFKVMGISAIYLFGSRAQNKTHQLSDFDIGIVFKKPEKYRENTLDIYTKLYDIFTDILPHAYLKKRFQQKEHEVDIVFLQFASFNLQFEAIKNGKIIYQENDKEIVRYKEKVMKKIADLQHIYEIKNKAILDNISI